jgi:hypothetical protein
VGGLQPAGREWQRGRLVSERVPVRARPPAQERDYGWSRDTLAKEPLMADTVNNGIINTGNGSVTVSNSTFGGKKEEKKDSGSQSK